LGENIQLRAADGRNLAAYLARPAGKPRAGLVVLQEVFGVTAHIRRVTDAFAADGYLALAPALFDRVAPGIELDYSEVARGRDTMLQLDLEGSVLDIAAAVAAVGEAGNTGVVGYCWGGAMADLAACKLDIAAAICYYGGRITSWLELRPGCPVMYHFGELDSLIPMDTVEQIRAARPDEQFFIYPDAGHGFNCDERKDYHPASAALARQRSLDFLARHLG
jgi:carboxymethylenebutenolidase